MFARRLIMNGETISHYKVLRHVSDGVGGRVYQAEDTNLKRKVALKFLPLELADDPEASRRFLREARSTSNIDHPNICNIHEIGETEEGAMFIAMAWYNGQTLKKRLAQKKLSVVEALGFARKIAAGLARAHESGVVHRDIKPANIIITRRGELKIVDFGLARLLSQARMTQTGTVLGTASYMAPEQARGDDADSESDIWSTGVVLYEMLTGRLPFHGESEVAMLYSVLNCDPDPLGLEACPEEWQCRRIIAKCLNKDPAKRYPTATALAEALNKALAMAIMHERRTTPYRWRRKMTDRWRNFRIRGTVATAVVLTALTLTLTFDSYRQYLPFLNPSPPRGVAVLPFAMASADPDERALANGLSWYLAGMISHFEGETEAFWLVPPGVTQNQSIATGADALRLLGVGTTVSGTGRIQNGIISLRITVNDTWHDEQTTHVLEDNLANLETWQHDLASLVLLDLDPKLDPGGITELAARQTNVPESFGNYLTGVGYAHEVGGDSDFETAATFLNRSAGQDSSFAWGMAALGYVDWRISRGQDASGLAEAELKLRKATALDATNPQPWVHLASLVARRGETEQARELYLQALERDPSHAGALRGLANLERVAGFSGRARDYLDQALAARPDYFWNLNDLGIYHYYEGDFPLAVECFGQMVQLAPQQVRGYNLLGAAQFEMDQYAEAEDAFVNSLAIEPSYTAYSNLATLSFYSGRLHDSADFSRKALALDDSRYPAWRTLAESLRWTPGMRDSSKVAFRQCIELVSAQLAESRVDGSAGDPVMLSDLATFHVSVGEFTEAAAILANLEPLPNLETAVMFNLAAAYEEMKNRDRALHWLEKAVAADLSLSQVEHYPGLRNLRTHPRFQALRERYGE